MQTKFRAAFASLGIAALMAGCSGVGLHAAPQAVRSPSGTGTVQQLTGNAASATLTPDGTLLLDLGGPGHLVEVQSVQASAARFALSFDQRPAGRTVSYLENQCGDACAGSSAPPRGQATPPPNYDSCSRAGGATWYNSLTGSSGCVQGGGEQPLSCGKFKWSSPGRGKLIFSDGSILDNIDWAIDHGESGCTLG